MGEMQSRGSKFRRKEILVELEAEGTRGGKKIKGTKERSREFEGL